MLGKKSQIKLTLEVGAVSRSPGSNALARAQTFNLRTHSEKGRPIFASRPKLPLNNRQERSIRILPLISLDNSLNGCPDGAVLFVRSKSEYLNWYRWYYLLKISFAEFFSSV